MLTSMAGADFSYVPGDLIDVTDEVAEAWHAEKLAEIVEQPVKKGKKAVNADEADHASK